MTPAVASETTAEQVSSFVRQQWWMPDHSAVAAHASPVRDASTGEALFHVSADGLDLASVVDYGRTVGQRELGKLTFHQRALKLKELAQFLRGHRESLYELSLCTGATKVDNLVDIDGGIGVLFAYSSKGRRELPNAQIVVDGPTEMLSKDGSFVGEHIYSRIPGVAVQINAFNFPVWGMLEKLAPAFIAGVPSIVKPATPTAYVTAAVVRLIIESDILPPGSLQLISGSAPTLLAELDYHDVADAIALAAMGTGSLVATVATNDADVARELVTGIAAHHGRVLVLNREDARTSTGHGSPVPQLVHGGPGRAGGGEELGGMRSVLHHMQRTAIQGSPNMLTAVTGVWHTGADQHFGEHPFRKNLATLRVGDAVTSELRQVTLADITAFANTTGDTFYAHTNQEAAAANPFFPGIVAHGYLLLSWAAGLFVSPEPGPVLANYGLENARFVKPVAAGDCIRVTLTAKKSTARETDGHGEVCWDAVLHNQDDEVVATYDVLTLVEK